jgi:tetratricopeptide (TPR) repeat protein
MEKSRLYQLIKQPGLLTGEDQKELQQLFVKFPTFLPAGFLNALYQKNQDSVYYDETIKNLAIRTQNRQLLNDFLHKDHSFVSVKTPEVIGEETETIEVEVEAPIIPEQKQEVEKAEKAKELEEDILSHAVHSSISVEIDEIEFDDEEVLEIKPVKKEVTSSEKDFFDWLDSPETAIKEDSKWSYDEDLINKFIQEEPRIKAQKDFYSPIDMAQKSVEEDENLISETLAKIYAAQGSYNKAIKAYEKLSLKYPEKSAYFADLIRETKEKKKKS